MYQECHHPEAFTAQAVAQQEHISGHRMAKVVIATKQHLAAVVPSEKALVLNLLRWGDDVKSAKNYVRAALGEVMAGKPVSTASTAPYGCTVKY